MTGFGLRKNMVFDWSGSKFRIDRLHKNDDVVLERLADGSISVFKRQALLTEYREGKITAVSEREAGATPTVKVFSRPLDELSEVVQMEVTRRRHYLQAICDAGSVVFTKAHIEPLIQRVAAEIDDPKPPSTTSIYRWHLRYRSEKDSRALIPRTDRRGSHAMKQNETVLRLASDSISEAFKVSPMASGPSIYTRLLAKIEIENRYLIPKEQLKAPSLRTVYRMLLRLDAYDRAALKEGKIAADKRFTVVKAGVRSAQILERVEIDHTPLDLFLIDEKSRLPLGRPTLTVVVDHYSRMLLGFHLSFGNPSTAAVMGALRHAILPKEEAMVQVNPELKPKHTWQCYGRPDVMVVDNGMEFHGKDLESVAYDLGIRIQFCPKHQPRFKGVVERYLGTCNRFFAHQLPGTSLSRWHLRGDYDPLKHAVLTLSDFQMIFHKWVLDVYAQTVHRGTGETPWARWHEGLKRREPELPESVHALKQRIGQIEERTLRADGILLHGIRYNGESLAPILRAYGPGTKVRVLFDSEDLGDIQVWGPNSPEPVVVSALDQNHARGLTALQNDLIRTAVREKGASQQDRAALAVARQSIISTVENLMSSRKQKDRRRAAEILGASTSKPATETSPPLFSAMSQRDGETHAMSIQQLPQKFAHIDALPPAYAFFRSKRKSNEEAIK
jgi:putative transposase